MEKIVVPLELLALYTFNQQQGMRCAFSISGYYHDLEWCMQCPDIFTETRNSAD